MNLSRETDSETQTYEIAVVSDSHRAAVFALRSLVFVQEQSVPPEEEWDAYDDIAVHFLARTNAPARLEDNGIIGTARLVDKGEGLGKVGRVAVRMERRGEGIGAALMRFIEDFARRQGFTRLTLDAQLYAIPFYERLGYEAEGDVFLDANIQHRRMNKSLEQIAR